MDAAVQTAQQQRQEQEDPDSDRDSDASMDSVSSDRGTQRSATRDSKQEEKRKKKKRPSKYSSQKLKVIEDRISQYREGKKNLPAYEIIQNSFHVKTGKVDLQLCDDMGDTGITDTVQGTMLIEVCTYIWGSGWGLVILCCIRT